MSHLEFLQISTWFVELLAVICVLIDIQYPELLTKEQLEKYYEKRGVSSRHIYIGLLLLANRYHTKQILFLILLIIGWITYKREQPIFDTLMILSSKLAEYFGFYEVALELIASVLASFLILISLCFIIFYLLILFIWLCIVLVYKPVTAINNTLIKLSVRRPLLGFGLCLALIAFVSETFQSIQVLKII